MEIIKKKTTLNNLSFNVLLTQNMKNLGLMVDESTDLSVINQTNVFTGTAESRLTSVRSFDFNNPYKVGVNGVTAVTATDVTYIIDGITYNTNLATNATSISLTKTEEVYSVNNFVRTDNIIGLSDKVSIDDTVDIERPVMSVIENFSKLQQISNPDEFQGFANNYYEVYDQTS